MTGMQVLLLVGAVWVVLGTLLAAVATLLLTRAKRRLVWDDSLPVPAEPVAAEPAADVEQATA